MQSSILLRNFLQLCPLAGSQDIPLYITDDNGDLAPIGRLEEYDSDEFGEGTCLHFTNPKGRQKPMTVKQAWKGLLKLGGDVSVGRTLRDGTLELFAIFALAVITRPDGSKAMLVLPEEY